MAVVVVVVTLEWGGAQHEEQQQQQQQQHKQRWHLRGVQVVWARGRMGISRGMTLP